MKTETKTVILFFAGCLMCLMLAVKFTPTKQEQDEIDFTASMADTSQVSHSEIQVQELCETYLYLHSIEPKYLNND